MTHHSRPHVWSRRRRTRVAALAVGAVVLLGGGRTAGAGPAQEAPSPAGPTAAGSGTVACLDDHLRPTAECPAVDIQVTVKLKEDDLVIRVANAGSVTWHGGPLAVEVPVPDADVDEPAGRDDPTGKAGTPEWTTRAGTVVSRCVFDPVTELRPDDAVSCRLHRLGLADGERDLWLTGFVGGLPEVNRFVGDVAPGLGVVPAAQTRSVRIQLGGTRASVVEREAAAPDTTADDAGSPSATGGRRWAAIAVVSAAFIGGVTALVLRRRRKAP